MATKYSSLDILNMSEQRPETLTPYQRKLVRAYREPVTTAELSRVSGIDEDEIKREIRTYRHYGLNPNTLHYVRGLGYTIDTNAHMGRDRAGNKGPRSPETLIAVTVATQSGVILQFWHPETIARWQAEVDAGIGFDERNCPPLDEDVVQIIYRPEDMKETKTTFSDQAIVRLGGQVQYSAVSPSQRPLVSYMRQHPTATLSEARRHIGRR